MQGQLLGAFCERGGGATVCCLELWAYPDTTLNLVVNRAGAEEELEYSFPCAVYQLFNVLEGPRELTFHTSEGTIAVRRDEENLTATFISASGSVAWVHSVPVEPFVSALRLVAPDADRFLA